MIYLFELIFFYLCLLTCLKVQLPLEILKMCQSGTPARLRKTGWVNFVIIFINNSLVGGVLST